jgi:CheY-like chemotaxis protein
VTILALETDSARAATIRRIVSDLRSATLTLVRSKTHLIAELQASTPDVLLLPVLLSPNDEAELLTHIRAIESQHVETLFTPFAFAAEERPVPRSWLTRRRRVVVNNACDPAVFAERLSWSLRRAHTARLEYAERLEFERELLAASPSMSLVRVPNADDESSIWLDDAGSKALCLSGSDRRAFRRFAATDLPGLRTARLRSGSKVRLVDFSAKGTLLETDLSLRPDSEASLELVSHAREFVVPLRVLRCHVSEVKGQLLYQGACVFDRELDFEDLLEPGSHARVTSATGVNQFDLSIKEAVDGHIRSGERAEDRIRELEDRLKAISDARQSGKPGFGALRDLVGIITNALRQREQLANVIHRIEEHLRAVLPGCAVQFAAGQAQRPKIDRETIFFQVPTVLDVPYAVLAVELQQGSVLEDWQFRLLRASTYLVALLPLVQDDAPLSRPAFYGVGDLREASVS